MHRTSAQIWDHQIHLRNPWQKTWMKSKPLVTNNWQFSSSASFVGGGLFQNQLGIEMLIMGMSPKYKHNEKKEYYEIIMCLVMLFVNFPKKRWHCSWHNPRKKTSNKHLRTKTHPISHGQQHLKKLLQYHSVAKNRKKEPTVVEESKHSPLTKRQNHHRIPENFETYTLEQTNVARILNM